MYDPTIEHHAKVEINELEFHVAAFRNVSQIPPLLCSKLFNGSLFHSNENKVLTMDYKSLHYLHPQPHLLFFWHCLERSPWLPPSPPSSLGSGVTLTLRPSSATQFTNHNHKCLSPWWSWAHLPALLFLSLKQDLLSNDKWYTIYFTCT